MNLLETKAKYWLLVTDLEMWTAAINMRWIALEGAQTEKQAIVAAEQYLQDHRSNFSTTVAVELVKRIKLYSPNSPSAQEA